MYSKIYARIFSAACLATLVVGCGDEDKFEECEEQTSTPLTQFVCLFTEHEPNGSLDNANVLTINGSIVEGSVQKGIDASDFFIFTPAQTGEYTIDFVADVEVGYVVIYDQSQTTIASTSIGDGAEQNMTADLVAGMAYYIEVNGYSADVTPERYLLSISGLLY